MVIRRLFTGGYGPLLALCALVGVLWAGSYRSVAHVKLPVSAGGTRWQFMSYRGTLAISLCDNHPTDAATDIGARSDDGDDDGPFRQLWDDRCATAAIGGFSFEDTQIWVADREGNAVARRLTAVNLPYWALLALALLGPLHCAYVIARAHRRTTHNQCGECGYELGDGVVCQACAARAAIVGGPRHLRLVHPIA